MRRAVVFVVGLCVGLRAVPAGAGDAPPSPAPGAPPVAPAAPVRPAPAKPTPPPTPEQAADAVLSALAANDAPALKALASRDDPDPWLVADELIRRAQHDAAEAFAKAAPRKATERLPGYVVERRADPTPDADRASVAGVAAALAAKAHDRVLAVPEPRELRTVSALRVAHGRSLAFRALRRSDECEASCRAVLDAARRLGWWTRAAAALDVAGQCAYDAGRGPAVVAAWGARHELLETLGDRRQAARALGNLGIGYHLVGDETRAVDAYVRALDALVAVGDRPTAAATRVNLAISQRDRGEYAAAATTLETAVAEANALGDGALEASASSVLGTVYRRRGDPTRALELAERTLSRFEAAGEPAWVAEALACRGQARLALGDAEGARDSHERARAMFAALGDARNARIQREAVAVARASLGDYAAAAVELEEVLSAQRAAGDRTAEAATLANLGSVWTRVGDHQRARLALEDALEAAAARGDRVAEASRLVTLGAVLYELVDDERAIAALRRAAALERELGNPLEAARASADVGLSLRRLGRLAEADAELVAAIDAAEAAGNRQAAARALSNLGGLRRARGDLAAAKDAYARALAHLERSPNPSVRAYVLWGLAVVRLDDGDPVNAARLAREGVDLVLWSSRDLSGAGGATAREVFAGLFDVGVHACAQRDDAEGVHGFLERASAGSWRELVEARRSPRAAEPPAELVRERDEARRRARAARDDLEAAHGREDVAAIRAAQRALADADGRAVEASARVERAIRRGRPSGPATLDDVETTAGRLRADEAYVACWPLKSESVALVVRGGVAGPAARARVVRLAAASEIESAAGACRAESKTADVDAASARLRELVVAPLGLGDDVRRVLFAPVGALGFVPPSVLWPDREVVYVPSATALGMLAQDRDRRGDGVLALGDPAYRHVRATPPAGSVREALETRMRPLPETRAEALAIGTTCLLDVHATEAELARVAPTRPRWRALHFACHGLVDEARPQLSALAIAADGQDDGLLMAYEIGRLRFAADLVTLSACGTAKGKVFRTEGIVGLTAEFLAAGTPRVLSSLWKVDSDATAALMTKFYELWNPKDGSKGLPTAEALRSAQAFVRAQEQWKHPYYWAAWVLWGLPD